MPQLDPEAGVPTIQLVHLEIGRCLDVYKMHRLSSSPLGELAILREVSSALPGHSLEEEGSPDPEDFHPPRSKPPQQERESLLDRSLARVCKVHQKALSTTATLEEEIKRLQQMKAHSSPEWRQRDRDSQGPEERSRKRRRRVGFSSHPTASQSANPDMPSGRMGSEGRDSDLGEPLQLKVEVACFLQGSSKMPEDEGEEMLPEPSIYKSIKWVQWKAEKCDVPNWWLELSTVPQEDTGRLAQELRASFQLPRHMHELDPRESPFHVPSSTMSPPTEVHAPHHIYLCLPGYLGNSQGEDGHICPSFAVPCGAK